MEDQITKETGETRKVAKVNTGSFIDYLVGLRKTREGLLRGDLDDFEKRIRVPEKIHKIIKEMYLQKREGQAIGPKRKERQKNLALKMDKTYSGLEQILREQEPEVGEVEQVRVIYLNTESNKIESTNSFYGYGSEVNMHEALNEAVTNDGLPMMVIHTHPTETNFSFKDYSPLLIGEPTSRIRLMRAQMVLLPGMQLMAVVTKDTPFFENIGDMCSFMSTRVEELNEKELQMAKKYLERLNFLFNKKFLVEAIDLIKQKRSGEKYYREEDGREEIEQQIEDETKKVPDEIARMINRALVAFGREMNVKLYFSQDMKNFREFSA